MPNLAELGEKHFPATAPVSIEKEKSLTNWEKVRERLGGEKTAQEAIQSLPGGQLPPRGSFADLCLEEHLGHRIDVDIEGKTLDTDESWAREIEEKDEDFFKKYGPLFTWITGNSEIWRSWLK